MAELAFTHPHHLFRPNAPFIIPPKRYLLIYFSRFLYFPIPLFVICPLFFIGCATTHKDCLREWVNQCVPNSCMLLCWPAWLGILENSLFGKESSSFLISTPLLTEGWEWKWSLDEKSFDFR